MYVHVVAKILLLCSLDWIDTGSNDKSVSTLVNCTYTIKLSCDCMSRPIVTTSDVK